MRHCFNLDTTILAALRAQQQRVLSQRVEPGDELLSPIRGHPFRPTTRIACAPSYLTHSAIGRLITVLCNPNTMWKDIWHAIRFDDRDEVSAGRLDGG